MWRLVSGRLRAALAAAQRLKHSTRAHAQTRTRALQSVAIEFALSGVFESRGGL